MEKKQWKLNGLRDNSFSIGAENHLDDLEIANDIDYILANPIKKDKTKKTPMQKAMLAADQHKGGIKCKS
jgi:thiamine monophosphate synthase